MAIPVRENSSSYKENTKMTTKSLLMIGALALASIASAKSYDIVLASPAKAGNLQLGAGQYTLQLKGTSAVFTNVETGKSFTAPVKVENAGKKFQNTAVDTENANGTDQIKKIELGGSSTALQLGE
jgi:hypothetical protein